MDVLRSFIADVSTSSFSSSMKVPVPVGFGKKKEQKNDIRG